MNTLEKILCAATLAATIGCETPRPQRPAQAPKQTYSEPNTIRLSGNGAKARGPQEPRRTIIMNEQHPNGIVILEDGTSQGPLVAPVESLTVVLPPVSYPSGVPKGWTWEQQGNWYRSPDRKYLWIDGNVRQSLETQTRRPDHELIPHGSEQYAPQRNR